MPYMDALPPGFLNGIGVVGVVLVVGWMIFTGRLVTRREVDAKDRQLEALTKQVETLNQTVADFKDAIAPSHAMIKAVLDVARERTP